MEPSLSSILASKTRQIRKYAGKLRHYATAGPAFWRSASSKINGAFVLTNSVKKVRSSADKPSTLNHLTAGKKHSAWSKLKSTGRSSLPETANA